MLLGSSGRSAVLAMPAERTPLQLSDQSGSPPAKAVELRPGQVALADWRAVYAGSAVSLDFVARADVEAGAAAMAAFTASGAVRDADEAPPLVAEMIGKGGDRLPAPLVRLFVALKLAALAQGGSGVRWAVIARLSACIADALLPAVPAEARGDRQALSYVLAMLTGTGDILSGQRPRSAAKALKRAGLAPLKLAEAEKQALLSGAQFSLALALSGLFEAECLLQSALVAEALAIAQSGEAGAAATPPLRRGRQADAAATLQALLRPRASAPAGIAVPLGGAQRTAAQAEASLDVLRHAGEILEREANAPSEAVGIVWQTGEIVLGGGAMPALGLAADLVARALGEIARMAERRIASLDAASGAVRTDPPGLASGFAAQIRERAAPVPFPADDDADTSAALAGVERLRPLAGTVALLLAILALAASRAESKPGQPGPEPDALDGVRRLLRDRLPDLSEAASLSTPEVAAAADLVRTGALAAAPGIELPNADPPIRLGPPRRRSA